MDAIPIAERLRRVDRRIWDGLLAALVTLGTLAATVFAHDLAPAEGATTGALVVGSGVALALRRRAPLAVAVLVGAACTSLGFLQDPSPLVPALAIASYTAGAERPGLPALGATVPIGVAAALVATVETPYNWVETLVVFLMATGLPLWVGRTVFVRRRRAAQDRELAAREAVTVERARLARELHDVVAHAMSVMVVQAGAARAVVARDPGAAEAALRRVEDTGREGLAEMRRLLGVLRAGAGEEGSAPLAPQPGLDRLGDLLERTRAAGLPVERVTEGTPRPLPAGVDLSAFRIVQEALTNALRHAGPAAHARVLVRYGADAVEIEVADDGRGPPPDAAGGHGLVGMRERVTLTGGTFEAGARSGGGFVVRASLPTPLREPGPAVEPAR